jgi:hypothetical protein
MHLLIQMKMYFSGLVSDYIRRQRRREAASLAIGSDDDDESEVLPRTIEMERVRRAVRQQRDEEHRSIARYYIRS